MKYENVRKFKYMDTQGNHIIDENQIMKQYFPEWSRKMQIAGKENLISKDRCIDDFCTINWAWELKGEVNE